MLGKELEQQDDKQGKAQRIAHNTVLLFSRMFILTILNFIAIRLVLKGLGQEDYGLFNTVAGVVTTTTFICSILSLSIQRFYSVALGQDSLRQFSEVYTASIHLVFLFCILCLLFFETVGLWFVQTQLTIPTIKLNSVILVYQIGVMTFICSLLQIPFTAAVFAKEDMGIYSIISTLECVGKLIVAYLIGYGNQDRLVFYSGGLLAVSLFILLGYLIFCKRNYAECIYRQKVPHELYKNILSFSGWTTFGSLANTGLTQGSIILINIFFGPIANAAFGIAQQINNAFSALSNAMILPFRPAMIKAYSENRFDFVNRMFIINSKIILFSLIAISVPIISEMDIILQIWLGQTSEEMIIFSRLMIVYIIFITMHNPITIIIHASGQVKNYHLIVDSLMLLCFPLTWICYKLGTSSQYVFYCMITLSLVAHIERLFQLKKVFSTFSIKKYITSLAFPSLGQLLVCTLLEILLRSGGQSANFKAILACTIIPVAGIVTAYFIGINPEESKFVKSFFRTSILKRP